MPMKTEQDKDLPTSANILARMGKNQYVSMETIEKICKKLDCTIDEIMEFTD